jgi:hypothetical protein
MIRPRFWRGRSDYFFFRAFFAFLAFFAIGSSLGWGENDTRGALAEGRRRCLLFNVYRFGCVCPLGGRRYAPQTRTRKSRHPGTGSGLVGWEELKKS